MFAKAPACGETLDGLLAFNVDIPIFLFIVQIVLLDDVLGKWTEWDMHIFKVVKGCSEVEIFDIDAHILGFGCAENTIPKDLGRGQIGGACCELPWVCNKVASYGDAGTVGIRFLGTMIHNYVCVDDGPVFRDGRDLVAFQDEEGVRTFGSGFFVTLGKVAEFFAKGRCPDFFGDGILGKFLVG